MLKLLFLVLLVAIAAYVLLHMRRPPPPPDDRRRPGDDQGGPFLPMGSADRSSDRPDKFAPDRVDADSDADGGSGGSD